MKSIAIGLFLMMVLTSSVRADDGPRSTLMTLDSPIEIPGYFTWDEGVGGRAIINDVLSAGSYMLQIVNLSAERAILRVTNVNGNKVYATLMAVPELERRVPAEAELTFFEAEDRYPALHAWHRGGRLGLAFVYPIEQALMIAEKTGMYVIAAEEAASGPWIAQDERIKGLLAEPLVVVYPDGTELPLVEVGGAGDKR